MPRGFSVFCLCSALACGRGKGVPDAGPPDAGPPDAGNGDAGSNDAGNSDAGPATWLEITQAQVPSDGHSASIVILHARGAQGVALAGQPAKILVSPSAIVTPGTQGATDGKGDFQVALSSTSSGLRTLSAWSGGRAAHGQVTFVVGSADERTRR